LATDKVTRSIRLTADVDQRLTELCKHLGTNPNAYLICEIGKCISRDEVAFKSQKNSADLYSIMTPLLQEVQSKFREATEEQADMFNDEEA